MHRGAVSGLALALAGCGSLVGVDGDYRQAPSSASAVPPGWQCDDSLYGSFDPNEGDDATCECSCGAYDPDCDPALGATILDCSGDSCVEDAQNCDQCSKAGKCEGAN